MQPLNIRNFYIAAAISFIIAVAVLSASFILGKQEFFLLLNTDLGNFSDHFFAVFTYGGDAITWPVMILIVMFILKRKDVLPLMISSFVVITVVTQICKYVIVPHEQRPIKDISNTSLIHMVPGVEMHTLSSFPSGHTATAFCFYFLFCLLINKRFWIVTGLVYALLVGYSRIYLAEHFPLDVGAGIIVGIVSVYAAIKFQQYWWKRR